MQLGIACLPLFSTSTHPESASRLVVEALYICFQSKSQNFSFKEGDLRSLKRKGVAPSPCELKPQDFTRICLILCPPSVLRTSCHDYSGTRQSQMVFQLPDSQSYPDSKLGLCLLADCLDTPRLRFGGVDPWVRHMGPSRSIVSMRV